MNQNKSSEKLGKVFLIGFGVILLAIVVFSWLHASLPKWAAERNQKAVKALFDDKTLAESDGEPVLKRPCALYVQEPGRTMILWDWDFAQHMVGTELLADPGLTETVNDARTCVYIWADGQSATKSDTYEWVGRGVNDHYDAWFAPVYMTVIDREDGMRYADIKLGDVPLAERSKYAARYSGDIYNPEKAWSTFDLDGWLATHWE